MAARNSDVLVEVPCRRWQRGEWSEITDTVAREVTLDVEVKGAGSRRLLSADRDLETLAVGHALLEMCPEGTRPEPAGGSERTFVFETVPWERPPGGRPVELAAGEIVGHMRTFIGQQGLWDGTGCFHRASVFDPRSRTILHTAEDIGRHNCIDRIAAWAMRTETPLSDMVMLVSARVTASLFAKAAACGFSLIVSRSAVTTASVQGARDAGVTLIGFSREREERFTVFADDAGRVKP